MIFWMAASHRLRELREKAGLGLDDIAQIVGWSESEALDLDDHDTDLFVHMTLGELRSLCAALATTPTAFFRDAARRKVTARFQSPQQVSHVVARHLEESQIPLDRFEDRVGWGGVGQVRETRDDLWTWPVDLFVDVCNEVDSDWVASLDALFSPSEQG